MDELRGQMHFWHLAPLSLILAPLETFYPAVLANPSSMDHDQLNTLCMLISGESLSRRSMETNIHLLPIISIGVKSDGQGAMQGPEWFMSQMG